MNLRRCRLGRLLGVTLGFGTILASGCRSSPELSDKSIAQGPAAPAKSPDSTSERNLEETSLKISPEAIRAAGIVSVTVRNGGASLLLDLPGEVTQTADGTAAVTAPVPARVLRLLAKEGDRVQSGQDLAVLESVDLAERSAAIAEADRQRTEAQAQLARAKSELALAVERNRAAEGVAKRQLELARLGAFSQPALQSAERDLSAAQAALESARREAIVHKAQLERAERLYRQELVSRTDVENARLDVEKDRIAQEEAERAIGIAREAYEREAQVAKRGLSNAREVQVAQSEERATRESIRRAQIELQSAKGGVKAAETSLQNARIAYTAVKGASNSATGDRLTITAPISGVIANRLVTLGQALDRTTELFTIDDLGSVMVIAQLPESAIRQVQMGAAVSVSSPTLGREKSGGMATPQKALTGRVQSIGVRIDEKTRTVPILCRIENPLGLLRPGGLVRISLAKAGGDSRIVVPSSAIFREDGEAYVYVELRPGEYSRREVTLGRVDRDRVEISSGLRMGEAIVTKGTFTLRSEAQKDALRGEE